MKKIVSGLLMGLLFVGCAEQETTYTIQGEWEGGDGKVVYLKKDLPNFIPSCIFLLIYS